jgi:3-oxoacyl-[acyl-carrier-protein] synthase-3
MSTPVFITAAGKFLPGQPIHNHEIEEYLGCLYGQPSRAKNRILRQNGIVTRYYALDKQQHTTHSVSAMTAAAIQQCLHKAGLPPGEVGFLAAATTQGDLPVPGFASMVHGDAGLGACGISSHQSVCAAGMMAIESAVLHIQTGVQDKAVACAGEIASRLFKARRFEGQEEVRKTGRLAPDTELLRWMLSDGAGALLLEDRPAAGALSLRVDWIDIRSHAGRVGWIMTVSARPIGMPVSI